MVKESIDDEKPWLQKLCYEVRQLAGLERTPSQIREALINRGSRKISSACKKILETEELVRAFARELK